MKTFIYYNKIDSKKEILGKTYIYELEQAINRFARRKQLPTDVFLDLFTVKEYERKKDSKFN